MPGSSPGKTIFVFALSWRPWRLGVEKYFHRRERLRGAEERGDYENVAVEADLFPPQNIRAFDGKNLFPTDDLRD
jgi:hypothetical protein